MANFATSKELVTPGLGSPTLNPTTDFVIVFTAHRLSPGNFLTYPRTSSSTAVAGIAAGGVAIF